MGLNAFKGLLVVGCLTGTQMGYADFLPPNQLHLQDAHFKAAKTGLDEATFDDVIDQLSEMYAPIVAAHGGTLEIQRNWDDTTVNAFARRKKDTWVVAMFGGLARRPEINRDGFTLVLCHELGHQLGGFPFSGAWAANEGEADYFATQSCARDLWAPEVIENATHAAKVNPTARKKCDEVWKTDAQRNLCYRIADAAKSSAELLAVLNHESVSFDSHDSHEVSVTDNGHPAAQCRLDTYLNAALCDVTFDGTLIPGLSFQNQRNGADAETEAAGVSCHQKTATVGVRPRCWFKPRL